MTMAGHAYFNSNFSKLFVKYLGHEVNYFGVGNMFWGEFYSKHIKDLTLYVKEYDEQGILEVDSIDDLREFDSEFL